MRCQIVNYENCPNTRNGHGFCWFCGFSTPINHSPRTATIAHKRMGTARNAPTGPHIQVQNAMERKTRNGLIVSR